MVCKRCVLTVENQLDELGISPYYVSLGEVDFGKKEISSKKINLFREKLESVGFELLDTKASKLIERTKLAIQTYISIAPNDKRNINLSDYLKTELNYDYHYVSHLFSSMTGLTMEKYQIAVKIEKVKELLFYDELSLSEIADKLDYSSVAHLSNQFKKVTGLTPSNFKKMKDSEKRKPIDKL